MTNNNPPTQQEYDAWYAKIYGYFYRRVNTVTQARDLTNDTLADFFLYSKQMENPKALIFQMAKNRLSNFIRSKTRHPGPIDIDNFEFSYSDHYKKRGEYLIQCAKKNLDERQFAVVEMCILCDFTSKKVSEELQVSSVNVRQILSRSLKKIKEKCKQIWLEMTNQQ